MPNPRRYTDDQLKTAVHAATCWSDVMELLGFKRNASAHDVRPVVERLGLDTSHFNYKRSADRVPAGAALFTRPAEPGFRSGLSVAAKWFLDRNYIASVPLEVAPYDLVVESDDGLKRVQVKTTRSRRANRYAVAIRRYRYDPDVNTSARGRVRSEPYTKGEIDLFFVITSDGPMYLIPVEMVVGLTGLLLDEKYANFVIEP